MHPVIAGDLLVFGIDQSVMNTRQDRVLGKMLTQFIDETRLLRKGSGGVCIHNVLHVRIFDGSEKLDSSTMMPDYYATRKAHPL